MPVASEDATWDEDKQIATGLGVFKGQSATTFKEQFSGEVAIKATQSLENTDWMHISISKKELENKCLLLKKKHRINS